MDDEEDTNHNLVPDLSASFEEEVEQRVWVEQLLNRLPEKDRDIIRRYYGIGQEPQTLMQIAEVYGCRYQWIQVRIKHILEKLHRLARRQGDAV